MIGISCTEFSSENIQVTLDRIVGNFDLWEIFSEDEHSLAHNYKTFKDILPSYDIAYSIHAPICDINVASIYKPIRMASLEETIDTVKVANKLGIELVTVHPGLSSMAVHGVEEKYLAKAKKSMRALDKASKEYGVEIAVENMPEMYFFLGRTAEELNDIIDDTELKVCFDIGHANTTNQIDSMIDTFGDRIRNIHIHDNHGVRDEHLTIGKGKIDFVSVLGKLKNYEHNYVIEAKNFKSAVASKEALSQLLL